MPQELNVLRCFNCEAFQVDIVKKVPKWSCKICGEKQSVQQIYGTGTGQECRVLVQSLNEQRLTAPKVNVAVQEVDDEEFLAEIAELPAVNVANVTASDVDDEEFATECAGLSTVTTAKISKWEEFVDVEKPITHSTSITHDYAVPDNSKDSKWVYFGDNSVKETEISNIHENTDHNSENIIKGADPQSHNIFEDSDFNDDILTL